MELEEKVRILKEQFSSLPGILIKKTLCSDDINEDLEKCKQRLQEFNKQINNPSLRSTSAGTTTGLHDPSQEGCVSTDKAEDLSENGLENRNVKGGLSSSFKSFAAPNPCGWNNGTTFAEQRPLDNCNVKPMFSAPKLEQLSDLAKTMSQSPGIIAENPKMMVPDPPKLKSQSNAINSGKHSVHEASLNPYASKMAFEKQRYLHNGDVKPTISSLRKVGEVSDPAKIITQSPAVISKGKRMVPDSPKPKSKSNVNLHNNTEKVSHPEIMRTQKEELATTLKRNAPSPPKTKPKPAWRTKRVQNEVYKQKKTQNSEEDERHSSERTVSDASSNASVNTQELEEKIKKLKEEFPRSPRVLIKKTLCSDDVQCDLVKAKRRLQEFSQMDDSSLKSPVATEFISDNSNRDPQMNKGKPHSVQNEVYRQKKTQNSGEDEQHSIERTVTEASSNASMNSQELEDKIRKLQEEFPRSPRVLIKKTLCSDDVQCDLVKAKKRLQEFSQIDDPSLKSPVATGFVSDNSYRDPQMGKGKPHSALQRKYREQKYQESDETSKEEDYNEGYGSDYEVECGGDWQDNDCADNVRNWDDDDENDYDYDYEEDYNVSSDEYDVDDVLEDGYYDYEEDCEEVCCNIPVVSQPYDKLGNLLHGQTSRGRRVDSKLMLFSNQGWSRLQSTGGYCPVEDHLQLNGDNLSPSGWAPMPLDERGNEVAVHTVNLTSTCAEYQEVAQRVRQTLPSQNIVSIARIQNPFLYQSYQLRKQKMKKDNGGDNERQLFHGTNPDNVTKINTQGFDRSLSGSANGAIFGTGVYFARDASYSRCYTSNTIGAMYLARVLVGQYCKGDSSKKKPPPINPSRPEILFDSMVNDIQDPSIFVVYYDNQCYPEYLIRF